ncbi:hypothetical protein B566_EDAN001844 [Ephemera danica]|nr:hypothetical protein B566_EDAN001844 [Ephemera danica]
MSQHNDPRSIPFHVRPRRDPFEPFLARLLPVPSKRTIYLGDKPLVFGGTYPIDKPIASRFMPTKTFNIDEPADFARAKTTEAVVMLQPVQPTPTITMAGQRRQKTFSESSTGSNHKAPGSPKRPAKPATSPGQQQNSGWFGGIFSKMSWKPKNQMKLPDDKNPTIVWDEARGRWVNTEGGDNDSIAELKPPPKAPSMNSAVSQVPTSAPSPQQQQQQQTNGSAQPPPPAGAVTSTDGSGSGEPVTQFTTPASSAPNSPPESDQDHNQQQIPMMYNPTQFTASQNNFAYQR